MNCCSKSVFLIFIFLSARSAFGQWIERIQTDSDWEVFYREGFFDYNTFQMLRELSEGYIIADTTQYMISTLGTSQSEIVTEELQLPHSALPDRRVPRRLYIPDRIKLGRKIYNGDNQGYIAMSRKGEPVAFDLKLREEKGLWKVERRSIGMETGSSDITIGNFLEDIGCGLTIGRFDYRPVAYEPDMNGNRDILFPDNSYYNGINIGRGGMNLLYSGKKYGRLYKNVAGGNWTMKFGGYQIGAAAAATVLSSNGRRSTMGAASVYFDFENGKLEGEAGYGESGIGLCMRSRAADYDLRVWHYDRSFVNLQSSSFARQDYQSYVDEGSEVAFRQPQSGESGLFLNRWFAVSGVELTAASEIWKKTPAHLLASDNSIYIERWFDRISARAGFSDRHGTSLDRSLLDIRCAFRSELEIGLQGYLWIEDGSIGRKRSKYSVFAAIPIASRVEIGGRLRRSISGELDYFIEQKSVIAGDISFIATYRWNRDYDVDLGPLYVTMERLW